MGKRRKWNDTLKHCLIDDFLPIVIWIWTHLNCVLFGYHQLRRWTWWETISHFNTSILSLLIFGRRTKKKTAKRIIVFIYFLHFLSFTSKCNFLHSRRPISFIILEKFHFFSLSRLLESHGIWFFSFCYTEILTNTNWEIIHTERRIWK